MNFVRLPSGHVLNMDLVDELWTEESGDVKRYVSGSDDAYTLRGDDASALRAWMTTLPRLKTEADLANERHRTPISERFRDVFNRIHRAKGDRFDEALVQRLEVLADDAEGGKL